MIDSAENARLLHNARLMLRWDGVTKAERQILIGIRGRHKTHPAMTLTEKEAAWLIPRVARFQAETMGNDEVTE